MQANLSNAIREIRGRTMSGVTKAGLLIQREALPQTPLLTGALRNSCVVTNSMAAGNPVSAVAYTVAYAPYVHENMKAVHPVGKAKFLEDAIKGGQAQILAIIRQEVRIP